MLLCTRLTSIQRYSKVLRSTMGSYVDICLYFILVMKLLCAIIMRTIKNSIEKAIFVYLSQTVQTVIILFLNFNF